MQNLDNKYSDAVPYQPYLQDGDKHQVTGRDVRTNYWQSFFTAYLDRFPGRKPEEAVAAPVEEEAPAETKAEPIFTEEELEAEEVVPAVAAPACKVKKNVGAITVAFVASVLAIVLAAVSYFKLHVGYTSFFAGIGTKEVYDIVNGVIGGGKSMLVHGFAAGFIVAGLLTVVSFAMGIAALASKKAVYGVGVVALIALIATLAVGVLEYFITAVGTDTQSILCFLNPHVTATGVQWGFYFGAALLFIETICGFVSYRK